MKRDGFSRVGLVLVLPFIILLIAYGVYKIFFIPDPVVRGIDAFDFLPANKTVKLNGGNIQSIDISMYQNGNKVDILNDTPETGEKAYTLEIIPKDLGLTDGRVMTSITAKAGIFKEVQYNIESIVDTVPPSVEIVRAPLYVSLGSAGFAVLSVKDAEDVFVKLEEKIFKAFKAVGKSKGKAQLQQQSKVDSPQEQRGSPKQITEQYYVFFPAPLDMKEEAVLYAVARDRAGNENIRALQTKLRSKKYKSSLINIDDSFINTIIASLLNEMNISDPEAAFRKVNEEWREQSLRKLFAIAQTTEPDILWTGRFLQLKNSKVMATYGDKRTYRYHNEEISKSYHLGYDLASHAHAPVEAANSGIVRFAGDLSIYGNTVIVDHGLGLMSLYGHLSSLMVKENQEVEKGEVIGNTGSTGLAGGDHLHFGILVHGYEVSPLYWWDQRWVQVNILDYLDR